MTFRDLNEFQELMLRAYVRNMMLLATLPYHLAHEMRRGRTGENLAPSARAKASNE
jgi:hypothetical protein